MRLAALLAAVFALLASTEVMATPVAVPRPWPWTQLTQRRTLPKNGVVCLAIGCVKD
ncbi:hypothetical protein OH76DRAFT_1394773 [Lentinus brumalis]|uniref:Uncharacterized protein n=1 Tax=Lentinus brumalis TaxID=2498619 RepID=A0A371DWV8_9APHY|nr:hypothetical protein OH76DRAFT_1394773 [Polyporus brumalis]